MHAVNVSDSRLCLGWVTNWKPGDKSALPEYWAKPNAHQGGHGLKDLICVDAESIGQHTAVIAQSGSGKSFFMGRLVEEIILRTKAKCLIFDPNADFRRIGEIEQDSLWDKFKTKNVFKYTHEKNRTEFAKFWSKVPIKISVGSTLNTTATTEPLSLWWPTIPAQILGQDIPPLDQNDFIYCHETIEILGILMEHKSIDFDEYGDLFQTAHNLFRFSRSKSKHEIMAYVNTIFGTNAISKKHNADPNDGIRFLRGRKYFVAPSFINDLVRELCEKLSGLNDYVSINVERFYFGKAQRYESSSILESPKGRILRPRTNEPRVEVVDLPSLDENIRIDAIASVLKSTWQDARSKWEDALRSPRKDDRVPRFVIVDEAHNLMPAQPTNRGMEVLREEFRRIIAEGRKYGLFLVLVSQRPDKLDPLIVSECENKVIMKVSSKEVLTKTRVMLGLEDVDTDILGMCKDFKKGIALLYGKWTDYEAKIMYGAARRTLEGGRDLDPKYWAEPF